ncbi:GNAT family N-acetyltransferase [Croceicoccus mobilis]|nr:GNAT family N-acetyltransferase [Croceicoccus mobilis]
MPASLPIQTERLILRRPEMADAPALHHIASDERVASTTASIPHPYPDDGAQEFIAAIRDNTDRDQLNLVIQIKGSDVIGMAGFRPHEGHVELAYMIGHAHWGHGYATEAAHAIVRHVFANSLHDVILARAMTRNPASEAVIRKLGFRQTGVADVDVPMRGGVFTSSFWRLERADRHDG